MKKKIVKKLKLKKEVKEKATLILFYAMIVISIITFINQL